MKIVQSIQNLYITKEAYYRILQNKVSEMILYKKKHSWHFIHRIKTPESFALKLETGRYNAQSIFEDFFACTIVVENLDEIGNAEKLVGELFEVINKKPQTSTYTFKNTDSFPFDDLRIYCRLGEKYTSSLSQEVRELVFEIQIKTFLQHAWSIATHDIIYKTDKIAWGKERVAFQVKAALEQAEVAISGANELSKVRELAKENKPVKKINLVITILLKYFKAEDLPNDKRRLAQNTITLLDAIKITLPELEAIIKAETAQGRGTKLKNISPFQIIIQSICNQQHEKIKQFFRHQEATRYNILLTPEMDLTKIGDEPKTNAIMLNEI